MRSTFSRQFMTVMAVLLLAMLLLGLSFWVLMKEYLYRDTMDKLQAEAEILSDLAAAYDAVGKLSGSEFRVNLTVSSQVSGADTVICNAAGTVVLCSCENLSCQHLGLTVNSAYMEKCFAEGGNSSSGYIRGLYEEPRYVVSVPVVSKLTHRNVGIVMVSLPMGTAQFMLQKISEIFVFVFLVVLLFTVVVASLLTRSQTRPMKEMAKAAIAFGHGDMEARVRTDEKMTEEMNELSVAFNNMADSLQKSEYQRREFVANVSHELKTPMTTIGGYVDGILDGTIPPERAPYYMQIVSAETRRLSRLVRSMLDISRLQSQGGIPEEKKIRFDLEECVGQVLITFEQKINDKALNVDVDMPEHAMYSWAERDSITQVIYNLIDNAVKFSPQGGTLGIRLREGGSKIYASVSNEGETIPPEELPQVFERFHKTDKSRSQNRDGWGLGLYIVKTIICSHGENISVSSRDGKTEFTFTLPLIN